MKLEAKNELNASAIFTRDTMRKVSEMMKFGTAEQLG